MLVRAGPAADRWRRRRSPGRDRTKCQGREAARAPAGPRASEGCRARLARRRSASRSRTSGALPTVDSPSLRRLRGPVSPALLGGVPLLVRGPPEDAPSLARPPRKDHPLPSHASIRGRGTAACALPGSCGVTLRRRRSVNRAKRIHSARPHHSPEGDREPRTKVAGPALLQVVADYKRLSGVQPVGRAGNGRASARNILA